MPAIFYYNKTAMLPLFRFLGAFSNIVLNIVLIPFWGIYGAAIATTLSFIIMTIPMYIYTKMFFTIQYNWFLIILWRNDTLDKNDDTFLPKYGNNPKVFW